MNPELEAEPGADPVGEDAESPPSSPYPPSWFLEEASTPASRATDWAAPSFRGRNTIHSFQLLGKTA